MDMASDQVVPNKNEVSYNSNRQCYMITKEIWERGERIEEEVLQKTYERLMKKKEGK